MLTEQFSTEAIVNELHRKVVGRVCNYFVTCTDSQSPRCRSLQKLFDLYQLISRVSSNFLMHFSIGKRHRAQEQFHWANSYYKSWQRCPRTQKLWLYFLMRKLRKWINSQAVSGVKAPEWLVEVGCEANSESCRAREWGNWDFPPHFPLQLVTTFQGAEGRTGKPKIRHSFHLHPPPSCVI
jgi:hypothetical protein